MTLADWVEFLKAYAATFRGVRVWNATDTFPQDSLVVDSYHYVYKAQSANTNKPPVDNPNIWQRLIVDTADVTTVVTQILGTSSGSLAAGTVTPSGASTVSNCRAQRFPNSTDKTVCFHLSLDKTQGGWTETITLSGAAAFASGADGAQATLASLGDNSGEAGTVLASVVSGTTISISVTTGTLSGIENLELDVVVRGH